MWALKLCSKDVLAKLRFIRFVDEMISQGAKDFKNLCSSDQREIVGFYINALDDKTEWLVESNKVEITLHYLTKLMSFASPATKEDVIESIQDQAITYFTDILDEYIIELAAQCNRLKAQGE